MEKQVLSQQAVWAYERKHPHGTNGNASYITGVNLAVDA